MKWLGLLALFACTRPSAERALGDLEVGSAVLGGADVTVKDGMAAIRKLADHRLELWASAPVIEVTIFVDATMIGDWTIVANNVTTDAVLRDTRTFDREPGDRGTVATFRVPLVLGANRFTIGPADADVIAPYRIAAMADIQDAMPEVHDVFERISAVPDLRFVVAMGDITERAELYEYELFEEKLLALDIPFYSTIGNHELWADPERWFTRFGRMNFQFQFKGTYFTLVDSGDAGVDPIVEEWLDGWLGIAQDSPHVFLTHMPPIDPVGHRYGGFRSMRDAHRLLARLVEGDVDLTLYGHIHTYAGFENAGIPAHISGGGGADPMKLDGIDRHFLVLDVDGPRIDVAVERVD